MNVLSIFPYVHVLSYFLSDVDLCDESSNTGTCANYSVKWFYNSTAKKCDRFWYGGCEGNANRFDDERECKEVCINRIRPIRGKIVCMMYNQCIHPPVCRKVNCSYTQMIYIDALSLIYPQAQQKPLMTRIIGTVDLALAVVLMESPLQETFTSATVMVSHVSVQDCFSC